MWGTVAWEEYVSVREGRVALAKVLVNENIYGAPPPKLFCALKYVGVCLSGETDTH